MKKLPNIGTSMKTTDLVKSVLGKEYSGVLIKLEESPVGAGIIATLRLSDRSTKKINLGNLEEDHRQ